MTEHYHYTESGLDFVYLANGLAIRETPRGRVVSFTDLDGLHAAIGRCIVTERRRLSGPEVRFLRHELDLGQAELAGLLGVAERTVARWEKGAIAIPVTADATLRAMYREHLHEKPAVMQSLRTMRALDEQGGRRLDLIEDHGWGKAA